MIRKALALAYKDFQMEAGKRTLFTSLLFFSFMLIFLASFTLTVYPEVKAALSGLIYWLVLISIAFQVLNRSLASEEDFGCWDALCLCPISPRVIYLGKFIYNILLIIFIELITFPAFVVFLNLKPTSFCMLIPIFLASVGFVGVGLLFALFSLKTAGRELAIQVTVLPILLPALFIGLKATLLLAAGANISDIWKLLLFLVLYDLLFITIACLVFDTTLVD